MTQDELYERSMELSDSVTAQSEECFNVELLRKENKQLREEVERLRKENEKKDEIIVALKKQPRSSISRAVSSKMSKLSTSNG